MTSTTACWRCGHPAPLAVLVATHGREWDDEEASAIESAIFVNAPGDLPKELVDQMKGLVPSIDAPDDDPDSCLLNQCAYCEAILQDWHLCKTGGALIAEDGSPLPGVTATRLIGTPFALQYCGVHYADIQPVLHAALKAD